MTTEADRYNATVGKQLRAEIGAAGSSLAAVARDIEVSRSALDNWVTGKRAIPVPIAYQICAVLGISPRLVIERAEERFEAERPKLADVLTLTRGVKVRAESLDDLTDVVREIDDARARGERSTLAHAANRTKTATPGENDGDDTGEGL